jgi:hypothetical protein
MQPGQLTDAYNALDYDYLKVVVLNLREKTIE